MRSGAFSRKALLEDYEMGYWVDSIISNIFSILLGSVLVGWLFEKLAPKYAESLGYATKTVSIIAIVIALDSWILSSLTVDEVGLQLIAGVLLAGGKIFGRTRRVDICECEECGHGHALSKKSDQPLREGNRFSCTNCGAEISIGSFCVVIGSIILVNVGVLVGFVLNENWGIVLLLSGIILGLYTAGRDKREA